jgi:hypothetical protein
MQRLTGDRRVWAFNASVVGGDALSSERTLQEMLRRGIRPRTALIEMCPPAIAERNPWATVHMIRQGRWSDLPNHLVDVAHQHQLLRLLQYRAVPLYANRAQICKEAARTWQRWVDTPPGQPAAGSAVPDAAAGDALNWDKIIVKAPVTDDLREVSQRAVPELKRVFREYRPGGNLVAALERVMALCHDNGIEPVLVGVPVTSSFRQCVTPDMEASYRSFLAQFCRQHHCRFVDYYAALPDSQFVDYHHASSAGGEVFSKRLTAEELVPLLQVTYQPPGS